MKEKIFGQLNDSSKGNQERENIVRSELLDGEEMGMMHLRKKMMKMTLMLSNCWQHSVETFP